MQKTRFFFFFFGGAVTLPPQSGHVPCVGREQQVDNGLDLEENRQVVFGTLTTFGRHKRDKSPIYPIHSLKGRICKKQNDSLTKLTIALFKINKKKQ